METERIPARSARTVGPCHHVREVTAHEASFMDHETLVPGHEYTVFSLPPLSAWALLFAGKDVESRAFPTPQRGRVLVHAASERASLRESMARRAEVSFLAGLPPSALPRILVRRAILGSVEIVDCSEDSRSKWAVPGRHHWICRDPQPLDAPIHDVDAELEFWRWTYQPAADPRADGRRVPVRSGVVPALQASGIDAARRAATATRKRGV
jgi:hypothetical protein